MAASAADYERAAELAARLHLPLHKSPTDLRRVTDPRLLLVVSESALQLRQTGRGAPGPVTVDFGDPVMRHRRRAGHNEILGRAIGVQKGPLVVIDATARLGRDAFVLADLGCEVMLCERDRVVATMLQAGLACAATSDSWLRERTARMQLHPQDARQLPRAVIARADVLYLDPMFPARHKSAAVKKEMALFQLLLREESAVDDADDLLHWALDQDVDRVVLKRPLRAAFLAGRKPSHSLRGKALRFDVYFRPRS